MDRENALIDELEKRIGRLPSDAAGDAAALLKQLRAALIEARNCLARRGQKWPDFP